MKPRFAAVLLAGLVLAFVGTRRSAAQEFSETIRSVGEGYSRGYVAPLVDALGANMNAALIPAVQLGSQDGRVRVYAGFKVFGAFIPRSGKTFSTVYSERVSIEQDVGDEIIRLSLPAEFSVSDAPTFFGAEEIGDITVRVRRDTMYSYLGLDLPISIDTTFTLEGIGGIVDLDVAPFLVPEIVVGTLLGTDAMVRWVPQLSGENTESVSLFGLGVRHRLNPYLPQLPLDLAVQAVWQRAGADDRDGDPLVRVSTFAANLQVGKRFGLFGVYAALQSEQTSATIRYAYASSSEDPFAEIEPISTQFSLEAANRFRAIIGADLGLGPVHVTFDTSVGSTSTVSAGLGFAL